MILQNRNFCNYFGCTVVFTIVPLAPTIITSTAFLVLAAFYGQTNEKYKEDSRKSNTADRKPITYSRASNFGSKNEM